MQTHRKKRIEIVVEKARAEAVIERIEALGATGYTMITDVSGKGRRGERGRAEVLDVMRSVMIVIIANAEVTARILAESESLLKHTTGIISVGDVDVVRSEHF